MSRIDGNVMDFHPLLRKGDDTTTSCGCWLCQTAMSERAAFCHSCGSIQPVRDMTHFQRLGVDTSFELDHKSLKMHHAALSRIFAADRFSNLGPRQKQMVQDHAAALETAYAVLSDPIKRASYLLSLLDLQDDNGQSLAVDGETFALRRELERAPDMASIDRVAFKARHAIEVELRDLAAAFRTKAYSAVSIILARVGQLEDIAAMARDRRVTV